MGRGPCSSSFTTDSPIFNQDVIAELKSLDLQGKTIAQFACNNGRELLSAVQLGAAYGVGFYIA